MACTEGRPKKRRDKFHRVARSTPFVQGLTESLATYFPVGPVALGSQGPTFSTCARAPSNWSNRPWIRGVAGDLPIIPVRRFSIGSLPVFNRFGLWTGRWHMAGSPLGACLWLVNAMQKRGQGVCLFKPGPPSGRPKPIGHDAWRRNVLLLGGLARAERRPPNPRQGHTLTAGPLLG
jgi:hypothetical protein